MPFDPTLPVSGAPLQSAVIRSQFNSLKDLIDAVSGVTSAVVDAVTTLPPGDPAAVSVSVIGTELHLSFSLPRGEQGAQGEAGQDGQAGQAGPQGTQGPPFANAVVDSVTTLPAGDPAAVVVSFDGTHVRFNFSLPQGASGPPGEVTEAALNAALATTSNNSNAVSPLGYVVNDPPSQGDVQTLLNKLDELILALRR